MTTRIKVNGVTYDGVDSMPPDVRRTYERALADLPDLVPHGDGESVNITEGGGGVLRRRTVVRTNVVVNRGPLDGDEAAPPGQEKSGIELTFRFGSPGGASSKPSPAPDPIGSAGAERQFRTLLILGACLVAGIALWFVTRVH